MSLDNQDTTCTWCHGKGFITRDYDSTLITKARWVGLGAVLIFMTILVVSGGASGWWALIAILFLVGVFVAQFIADIVEEVGFWKGKKVVCPHCKGTVVSVETGATDKGSQRTAR